MIRTWSLKPEPQQTRPRAPSAATVMPADLPVSCGGLAGISHPHREYADGRLAWLRPVHRNDGPPTPPPRGRTSMKLYLMQHGEAIVQYAVQRAGVRVARIVHNVRDRVTCRGCGT